MTQKTAAPVFQIAHNIKCQRHIAKIIVQKQANEKKKFISLRLQGRKKSMKREIYTKNMDMPADNNVQQGINAE